MMRSVGRQVFVEGVADDRLADYRALTDVELRRRTAPLHGRFIAEGELVLRRPLPPGSPPPRRLPPAPRRPVTGPGRGVCPRPGA